MNKLLNIISWAFIGLAVIGCKEWTEPEPLDLVHNGGYESMNNAESEAYYAQLREYKKSAINNARPVAFGWFSNWSPNGSMRKGYLSAVPDSMDIISMWSGAPHKKDLTPEQRKDKEFVQKVKGTKLLAVSLLSYIGKGHTPEEVYAGIDDKAKEEGWSEEKTKKAKVEARWKYWGIDPKDPTNPENHSKAMAKFAKALYDHLVESEWDGYDIDWEIGSGVFDMDGTLQTNEDLLMFVRELGKYMGPASDPEGKGHKLICIDGKIWGLPEEMNKYVDYFIRQSYGSPNPSFEPTINAEKLIFTENFELSFAQGGNLLRQAGIVPPEGQKGKGYKGGIGAYRFDNDYNNFPDYKWMRQAIQINQQKFNEWKEKNQK